MTCGSIFKGHPLTDQARTIERIRRVNYGNLSGARYDGGRPEGVHETLDGDDQKLLLAINTDLLEDICNENEKSVQHMVAPGAK